MGSLQVRRGMNRVVLLCGGWAIKLPSLRNGHRYFVSGMLSNLLEADHWQRTKHPALARVYLSLPFGLLLVAQRYDYILTRRLTRDEEDALPFLNYDNNGHNAALYEGRIVLVDYGNPGMYLVKEN